MSESLAVSVVRVLHRLRCHPDVEAGPSVRAGQAFAGVARAWRDLSGNAGLLPAALVTLPHRLRVVAGVDADELVRRAVADTETEAAGEAGEEDTAGGPDTDPAPAPVPAVVVAIEVPRGHHPRPRDDPSDQEPFTADQARRLVDDLLPPGPPYPPGSGPTPTRPGRRGAGEDLVAVHPVRPGDRWRDLSVRHTLRASLRSGPSGWRAEDLRSVTRRHDTIYDVVVVLDVSASMGRAERPVVAPAATALVEAMVRAGMRVGAVVFSEEALVARRLSRSTVPFPAEGYAFADATNIEGGIDAGRLLLRREGVPGARPHVVLVTDAETTSHSGSDEAWGRAGAPSGLSGLSRLLSGGMTEAARRGALLAAGRCRRAGVTVSVVYPDRRADVAFAHALAAAGGGAARCLCS